jgi:voltage-gated potassium channel
MMFEGKPLSAHPLRHRLHEIIYEADTAAGKLFDVILILCILSSVCIVMLDSVAPFQRAYGVFFFAIEWFFTLLFTIEYLLRLSCIGRPSRYALSFYGIVDLLSILPTYIGLFIAGGKYLLVIRVLRLLRIFRVLKLVKYVGESNYLQRALWASRRKIVVFILSVLLLMVIFGSVMYIVEGSEHGFTSIPRSIYWAVVTMTTVGYGDISPQTNLGQALASFVMILGYGIIAIPTGIVTTELAFQKKMSTQVCPECAHEGHDVNARFCQYCGAELNPVVKPSETPL